MLAVSSAASSSATTWSALARVSRLRRRAASTRGSELSACIVWLASAGALAAARWLACLAAVVVGLERVDDGQQRRLDLLVHLDHPSWAVLFCLGDQTAGGVELLLVFGEGVGGGDEQWTGQARVGVRAGLLWRKAAVAVGQAHLRLGQALLGPGRVSQWTLLGQVG